MRLIVVTYCDFCGADITNSNHFIIRHKDGTEVNLCHNYTSKITETCADKYRKQQEASNVP